VNGKRHGIELKGNEYTLTRQTTLLHTLVLFTVSLVK
jgi:hypothetical protein